MEANKEQILRKHGDIDNEKIQEVLYRDYKCM